MRWITAIAVWFALAVIIALGLGSLNVPRIVQLYRHQATAQGTVVRLDCANHAALLYEFAVDGTRRLGHDHTANCRALMSGDPVTVYYVMGKPEISSLHEPGEDLINEIGAVLSAAIFVPLVAIFSWSIRRGFRRRASNSKTSSVRTGP